MNEGKQLQYLSQLNEITEKYAHFCTPEEMTYAAITHASLVAAQARDPSKDYEFFILAVVELFEKGLRESAHILNLKANQASS